MITKSQVKNLFYLDRDTDVTSLVTDILESKKPQIIEFLNLQINRLQAKEAGEYFTVEDVLKLKDGELENMQRFFRGAVVEYYARQKYNVWTPDIGTDLIKKATDEIKRAVGFIRYDHTGHATEKLNSMSSFDRVKDLNEFLNMIELVCFEDEGFIFPDSEAFKKMERGKGRDATRRQMFLELHNKYKSKFYKKEII